MRSARLITFRAFNIGEFLNDKPQQPFPKPLQPAEKEIGKFWEDCHKLCNRILQLLAVSLKVECVLVSKGPS